MVPSFDDWHKELLYKRGKFFSYFFVMGGLDFFWLGRPEGPPFSNSRLLYAAKGNSDLFPSPGRRI
jgi:hypothetical protein